MARHGGKMKSREPKELAPKRLERLRQILRMDHVVSVEELSRQLKVSSATVRRDLAQMESLGEVRRVHGGAVGVESRLEEPLFDDKTSIAAREKQRIAQPPRAAGLRWVWSNCRRWAIRLLSFPPALAACVRPPGQPRSGTPAQGATG